MKNKNGKQIAKNFIQLTKSLSIVEAIAIILETEVAYNGFILSLDLKDSLMQYLEGIKDQRNNMRDEVLKTLLNELEIAIKQGKTSEYIS